MITAARVHRRARRLLPAGLPTTGLLPVVVTCWEASPLARLPLGGAGRGLLGLRVEPGFAAELGREGIAALAVLTVAAKCRAGTTGYRPWRPLPRLPGVFCTLSDTGRRMVLLDGPRAAAWLLWQDAAEEPP